MSQLAQNIEFVPRLSGSGGLGVLQVIYHSATVYLHGSVNGTDYTLIESFAESEIKELVLCPYFKYSGSATDEDDATDLGANHKVLISETRGG